MSKLEFETNKPIELALHYTQGKLVESKFGSEQKMFSSDKGVFYVAGIVGQVLEEQIAGLGVQPGERIEIAKREVPNGRGRKSIRWQVARIDAPQRPLSAAGEQVDGTFVMPKPAGTVKAPVPAQETRQDASAAPRWANVLTYQTNVIVDVFAACLKHASDNHGNAVKADDVRSLLVTAFIQLAKGGVNGHA